MDLFQILITHNRAWTIREFWIFLLLFLIASVITGFMVKRKKLLVYQAAAVLLALIFLAVVFASTVFTRNPGTRQYQLELFWSWKEIFGIGECGRLGSITGNSSENELGSILGNGLLMENLLNMILLLPLGVLLPFIRGKMVSCWEGLLVGVITSLLIELLQLMLCRGLFEFDDIIHNAIGCMIGCAVGSVAFRLKKRGLCAKLTK